MSQHVARDPAFSRRGVLVGGPVHQEHVLLVAGEHLDHLTLHHADLILLHCHVVLGHQHGGHTAAAATAFTLLEKRIVELSAQLNTPESKRC